MAGGIGKKEAERIVADPPVEEVIHNDLEMVERLARLTAIGATDSRWDTQTKRTVLVILLVAAVFGVWLSRSVLGFLTMAVSLEAIFLSIFVLLAQNLHSAKEKIKGDIEYDVNIKAELEVAHLHEKVDLLHSEVTRRMHSLEKFVKTMGHAA